MGAATVMAAIGVEVLSSGQGAQAMSVPTVQLPWLCALSGPVPHAASL